jgi:hypothetical protein
VEEMSLSEFMQRCADNYLPGGKANGRKTGGGTLRSRQMRGSFGYSQLVDQRFLSRVVEVRVVPFKGGGGKRGSFQGWWR